MKNLLIIFIIACFSFTLFTKGERIPFKQEHSPVKGKEKKESSNTSHIEEAKTTLHSYSYVVAVEDFCFFAFVEKYFVSFKTVSIHLDHKVLFLNKYFQTLLRYFISPQAP
ncbi:MAG TPA: hypothetical protein VL947_07530 [Cytophagales bacterium]|nr:hypothetical protein [Cytophagales bacterium]